MAEFFPTNPFGACDSIYTHFASLCVALSKLKVCNSLLSASRVANGSIQRLKGGNVADAVVV